MRNDPPSQTNPKTCRAGFTYSISPTELVIKDTGRGSKTVLSICRLWCEKSSIGIKVRSLTWN
jgi:hypothetical protein